MDAGEVNGGRPRGKGIPGVPVAAGLWLAPLRGVTIRAFRETFAPEILSADFCGMVAPFIPANPGIRVGDRLLADLQPFGRHSPLLVPQVITRHPDAMRELLKGLKDRGFARVDLNAGCPFPMVVRRGRGSGLLRTPDMLDRLLEAGCDEMGAGCFSLKTRLGFERPDELLGLMPILNRYPLAAVTVHARTARQMYEGACDMRAFAAVCAASANPVIYNGDVRLDGVNGVGIPNGLKALKGVMVGRGFIRALGAMEGSTVRLHEYVARSQAELRGDRPVLGRMKELLSYWAESSPHWHSLWPAVKICRTVDELLSL